MRKRKRGGNKDERERRQRMKGGREMTDADIEVPTKIHEQEVAT